MKRISNQLWKVLFILFVATVNLSCNNKYITQKEQTFSDLFRNVNMNKMLDLDKPGMIIGEEKNDTIKLVLKNISGESIGFPVDCGVKIFYYSDQNGWLELDNLVKYFGEPRILQPVDNGLSSYTVVIIRPNFSESEEIDRIRVVVTGRILHEENPIDIYVGAYLDINIPK